MATTTQNNIAPGLDPTAVALTRSIRAVETGGNYTKTGDAGYSKGAYQWNNGKVKLEENSIPVNFQNSAKEHGLDPNDFSPTNQDKVAYYTVKNYLDKGYTQSQVASLWNSGSPEYQGKTGINKQGVKYDVPAYVNKVKGAYAQQIGATAPSSNGLGSTPPQLAPKKSTSLLGKIGGAITGLAGAIAPSFKEIGYSIAGMQSAPEIQQNSGNLANLTKQSIKQLQDPNISDAQKDKVRLLLSQTGQTPIPEELTRSMGQVAGSGLVTASSLLPYGTLSRGITKAAIPILGKNIAAKAGGIGASTAFAYANDVGSNLQNGKNISESLKPGLTTALGVALPVLGAASAKTLDTLNTPSRVINSLIKPLKKDFSYGKDPGRAVAGIVANNWDDFINKISHARDQTGNQIGSLIRSVETKEPILVKAKDSLKYIDDAMEKAAANNNKIILDRLGEVKTALTNDLGYKLDENGKTVIYSKNKKNIDTLNLSDAVELKRRLGDLTRWTGNPSDDKLVNATLKKVYGSLKENIYLASKEKNPEFAEKLNELNERFADLTTAKISAKYRNEILERQNLISFGAKTAGIGAGLLTAVATGGATVPSIIAGLSAAGLDKLLAEPAFKTRLAAALKVLTPIGRENLYKKIPILRSAITDDQGNTMFPGDQLYGSIKKTIQKKPSLNL